MNFHKQCMVLNMEILRPTGSLLALFLLLMTSSLAHSAPLTQLNRATGKSVVEPTCITVTKINTEEEGGGKGGVCQLLDVQLICHGEVLMRVIETILRACGDIIPSITI